MVELFPKPALANFPQRGYSKDVNRILRLAVVMLVVLAWSSLAFCSEIHSAAMSGDLEKIKALLKDNPYSVDLVNSKDEYGQTPLHWAAMLNHKDVAEFLLANKAVFSIYDVAAVGDLEKVKALLKDNPDLVFSKNTYTGNANDGMMLIGGTPLHYAAFYGHKDVAELLLINRADVNVKNSEGGTPLHNAATKGHKDVVELLLANKADVNAKANEGQTPLLWASSAGHKDVVELLLASNADVNAKGSDKVTPLHVASDMGYKDVAELLIANKADINAKDKDGATPLHNAAGYNHKKVMELLLTNKADVNAKDKSGQTPLHWAVAQGNKDVAELLRQHGGHE